MGTFVVVTYINHKLKSLKRIDGIRRGSKELQALEQEYALKPELALDQQVTPSVADFDPLRRDAAQPETAYIPSPLVSQVSRLLPLAAPPPALSNDGKQL